MPPGLKDVAARAGVSIKTASNVVNGYVHVAPETRARVQAAIDALGYVPNPAARRLRGGGSGVIALAVPELRSPYFAELAGHVVETAAPRGWTVLIEQTGGRGNRERDLVAGLRRHAIDGIVLCPVGLATGELTRRHGIPAVLLGDWTRGVPGPPRRPEDQVPVAAQARHGPVDHVGIDSAAAAAEATRHLLRLGRRRIAAIGASGRPDAMPRPQRLAGYRAALAGAGLVPDPLLAVAVRGQGRSHGAAAIEELLARGADFDAVFCFTDLLALGAMRALYEHGVDVPGDVAVIGFSNIEEGRYSTPTLSTIDPDTKRIAEIAVDMLAERLTGNAAAIAPREIRVEHRLLARESTLGRPQL
ncbi:LacI family DNA-binding transcriptional regulator [Actinoplanes subtropicus]|uniref:LacI family DNA-binding transcriptional regulator n=1 Tax=Actinoplanes subtropicus TaxID=543632 RepID=UPI0004C3CD6A|nr:LacI family DNA-binding transcriptional regulator [Actinoplanes subtropicus]